MAYNHAPHGYRSVTAYFIVEDAAGFMDYVAKVFDAETLSKSEDAGGRIVHAEMRIGDSIVEVSGGNEQFPPRPGTVHVFVGDTDACYERALAAGAESLYEPADMPYGERSAGIADPYGNHWYLATFLGGEGRGYGS